MSTPLLLFRHLTPASRQCSSFSSSTRRTTHCFRNGTVYFHSSSASAVRFSRLPAASVASWRPASREKSKHTSHPVFCQRLCPWRLSLTLFLATVQPYSTYSNLSCIIWRSMSWPHPSTAFPAKQLCICSRVTYWYHAFLLNVHYFHRRV